MPSPIPQPQGLPILGNIFDMIPGNTWASLNLDNRTGDTFAESFLITDFLEESGVCNEDKLLGDPRGFQFLETSLT
jgi:hypothetical protein